MSRRNPAAASGATRERLLWAAYELLGEEGMTALTHRRVEDRAGASHGSMTYHFGTREALIDALVHHNRERDHQVMRRVADDLAGDPTLAGADLLTFGWAWATRLTDALLADRHQAICRYELYLYAARHPEIQQLLRGYRNQVVAEHAATARAAGAPHPHAAARMTLALVEGIMMMNLSVPSAAQQAWAPTFMVSASLATLHLVEPPAAPPDEAAELDLPLFEWLDPATGAVARHTGAVARHPETAD